MVAEKPPSSSRAFVRPPIVATTPMHAGPLSIVAARASSKALGALSLSLSLLVEEGKSTFGVMAGIWAKF